MDLSLPQFGINLTIVIHLFHEKKDNNHSYFRRGANDEGEV